MGLWAVRELGPWGVDRDGWYLVGLGGRNLCRIEIGGNVGLVVCDQTDEEGYYGSQLAFRLLMV